MSMQQANYCAGYEFSSPDLSTHTCFWSIDGAVLKQSQDLLLSLKKRKPIMSKLLIAILYNFSQTKTKHISLYAAMSICCAINMIEVCIFDSLYYKSFATSASHRSLVCHLSPRYISHYSKQRRCNKVHPVSNNANIVTYTCVHYQFQLCIPHYFLQTKNPIHFVTSAHGFS